MKTKNLKKQSVIIATIILISTVTMAQNATELVKRADAKMQGEKSSYTEMSMKIVRPTWDRTVTFKSWTKGNKNSIVLITFPTKDKGQSFLRRDRDMWTWNPQISRMIKLPTSMLSQGWMGSDFTNDDLLNQSSIVVDYSHELLGKEDVSGELCHKINLMPKEDAPVVWGKIILWISIAHEIQMKAEYYDEDEYLVKTEVGSNVKNMSGRTIPTVFELIPAEEEGKKTVVTINNVKFNIPIDDSFFSQQNMKRLR